MLYALALIDRTNLGVARIAGMDHDLVHAFAASDRVVLLADWL